MPTPYIKKLSKKHNIPEEELEKLWNESKIIAKKKLNLSDNEKEWTDADWAYVTAVFKRKVDALVKEKKKKKTSTSSESDTQYIMLRW